MVRSGKYKLWLYGLPDDMHTVMFDLESDPDEMYCLADEVSLREVRDKLKAKVLDSWDPGEVVKMAHDLRDNTAALERWGRAVLPDHEDTLPVPPPDIENDIKLF